MMSNQRCLAVLLNSTKANNSTWRGLLCTPAYNKATFEVTCLPSNCCSWNGTITPHQQKIYDRMAEKESKAVQWPSQSLVPNLLEVL